MARTSELLVDRIRATADGRIVVLIDGGAASGKTTLAGEIAYALKAQLVCMDVFYPGWGGLEVGSSMVHSTVLDPERPRWRRWDWKRGKAAEWHSVNPRKHLVVDGSGALSAANRALATFGVWIRLDSGERRKRKMARDGFLNMEHWDRWALQEQRFFTRERPDLLADAVVEGVTGAIV